MHTFDSTLVHFWQLQSLVTVSQVSILPGSNSFIITLMRVGVKPWYLKRSKKKSVKVDWSNFASSLWYIRRHLNLSCVKFVFMDNVFSVQSAPKITLWHQLYSWLWWWWFLLPRRGTYNGSQNLEELTILSSNKTKLSDSNTIGYSIYDWYIVIWLIKRFVFNGYHYIDFSFSWSTPFNKNKESNSLNSVARCVKRVIKMEWNPSLLPSLLWITMDS